MQVPSRLGAPSLTVPSVATGLLLAAVGYAVAFDQGALAASLTDAMASSGGVLHELFHDARHLLGVPCH